jgi:hypothetical protein
MMNKDRLKEFVNALDALSDDVKDMKVDMGSTDKPTCGTCGCHAGLISIVAQDLPELKEIYKPLYLLECDPVGGTESQYIFYIWADALAVFLGFIDNRGLLFWAEYNPKLWGNKYGGRMFGSFLAFTDDEDKQLTHRDIIEHWKQVLANIENKGVKI